MNCAVLCWPSAAKGTKLANKPLSAEELARIPASKRPHDVDTQDAILRFYVQSRLEEQQKFYQSRIREFETNSSFTIYLSAAVLATSSFVSAIGAASNRPALALVTAILPAFSALIASFRQLYQWEKQANLYRDAVLGIEEAKLLLPDDDLFDKAIAPALLNRLVEETENVFKSEIDQWGQIALGMDVQAKQEEIREEIRKSSANLAVTEDMRQDYAASIGGGSIPPYSPPAATPAPVFPPPPEEEDGVG